MYQLNSRMRFPLYLSVSIFLLASSALTSRAAEVSDTVTLFFRQGHCDLDTSYSGNGRNLEDAFSRLSSETSDPALHLRRISFRGAASPEGSVAINRRLSDCRAARIEDLVSSRFSLPDSLTSRSFTGRDWPALRDAVNDDPNVPARQQTLALLDEIISADSEAGEQEDFHNLERLRALDNGRPYSYLYTRAFPSLRRSQLIIDYWRGMPLFDGHTNLVTLADPELSDLLPRYGTVRSCKPFYMSLRTNLLYDALAIPAIGAEFYLGKNLSIIANWEYGWWKSDPRHRYWRAYGGDLALRWWFGKEAHTKPLTGHHLGIYAGIITYDFEWGGTGYMGGIPGGTLWDRNLKMAGIEYGYSLPIAARLNLDFSIGIGFLGGKVEKYEPSGDWYVWNSNYNLHWVGPTKAEVSLVWLIGCGNKNLKGGK